MSVAPPAEYCAQSRKGRLYATRTGTVCLRAAASTVRWTWLRTWAGVPLVNQTAWGVVTMRATPTASRMRPCETRALIWATAPGSGGGT